MGDRIGGNVVQALRRHAKTFAHGKGPAQDFLVMAGQDPLLAGFFFELTCYPDMGRATSNALSVIKSIFIHYLPWDLQWR